VFQLRPGRRDGLGIIVVNTLEKAHCNDRERKSRRYKKTVGGKYRNVAQMKSWRVGDWVPKGGVYRSITGNGGKKTYRSRSDHRMKTVWETTTARKKKRDSKKKKSGLIAKGRKSSTAGS